MRLGILTRVRLLSDAVSISLRDHNDAFEIATARTIADLAALACDGEGLVLALIDAAQTVDLGAIREFHRDHADLPLVALGVREHEADIIAHGNAGFSGYVGRDDGVDKLCDAVDDALAGRLTCSPEIAAAMMRALFRRGPTPIQSAGIPLTRREHQVALLVGRAFSNKEIARELGLSESTVKHHVHSILSKFGVGTRNQIMRNMREELWPGEPLMRA